MEEQAPGLELGRIRPRRPARAHEHRDEGKGAAGRRRGEGGDQLLPLAPARLPRRQCAQPAPHAAAPVRHPARRQEERGPAELLLSPFRGQPGPHRRGVRRPGAADAAVLHAVGLVRPHRQPVRRRRRRQGRDRVLQRLSRRRARQAGAGEPRRARAVGEVRRRARRGARDPEPGRTRRAGARRHDRSARAFRPRAPRREAPSPRSGASSRRRIRPTSTAASL